MAAAASGKEPDPSLLLAMAMGCSVIPGGDDLLTRDAVTIEEYIRLMSHEAVGEEAETAAAERWHQVSSAGSRFREFIYCCVKCFSSPQRACCGVSLLFAVASLSL